MKGPGFQVSSVMSHPVGALRQDRGQDGPTDLSPLVQTFLRKSLQTPCPPPPSSFSDIAQLLLLLLAVCCFCCLWSAADALLLLLLAIYYAFLLLLLLRATKWSESMRMKRVTLLDVCWPWYLYLQRLSLVAGFSVDHFFLWRLPKAEMVGPVARLDRDIWGGGGG